MLLDEFDYSANKIAIKRLNLVQAVFWYCLMFFINSSLQVWRKIKRVGGRKTVRNSEKFDVTGFKIANDRSLKGRATQGKWVLVRNNGEFENSRVRISGIQPCQSNFPTFSPITLENLQKSSGDLMNCFVIFGILGRSSGDLQNNFTLHERN